MTESAQSDQPVVQPEHLKPVVDLLNSVLAELDRMLLGQQHLHRMLLVGVLSRGHILLEGLPGVGKTALIRSLADLLQLTFNRVQFTPDLMPGDILGTHILQPTEDGRREMKFQQGPIFTNFLLADEINRASPKTQSALLEAMQERQVSLMGTTHALPDPFFVLASQNPIELEGTYPLPEAQLDRFLFKLQVAHASAEVMDQIISTRRRGELPSSRFQLSADQLRSVSEMMESIYLPKAVSRYIARVVAASHAGAAEAPEQVGRYLSYGASPRAAIAIAEAGRGHALLAGRPTVGFQDVAAVAPAVLNHRVILNYQARIDQVDAFSVIDAILGSLDEAGLDLPDDVRVESTEST